MTYYEYKGELYYEGTSKVVPDNVKLKEGDIIYYENMPFDKDGYHATGRGIIIKHVLGMLIDRPLYDVDGQETVIY
jgi:hypothetical protein